MSKIILNYSNEKVGKYPRRMALVECPSCKSQRKIRADSIKKMDTTKCRPCIDSTKPTKPKEELFNPQEYYRSKGGKISHIYQAQKARSRENGWESPSYSREELIEWVMKQPLYHELFKEWEDSNYDKNLAPSLDRKNDYLPYSLDNIQLMSWNDNNRKGAVFQKLGINQKQSKGVIRLDMDGNYIDEFHSIIEAERKTGISNGTISRACRKENNTAGGYKWKYS